jgi:hypothetical protein
MRRLDISVGTPTQIRVEKQKKLRSIPGREIYFLNCADGSGPSPSVICNESVSL